MNNFRKFAALPTRGVDALPHMPLGLGEASSPHGSVVFLSPKLVCDALDRASPDAERLGHLQDTHALRKLVSHLAFDRAVYLRPAELHALGDSALETCFDPLANHRALKFSKRAR